MYKSISKLVASVVLLLWVWPSHAQFTWEQSSIGGGGFCMEIRFDEQELFGLSRALYLATDVSGVYRSTDFGVTWVMLWDDSPASAEDMLPRYTTSLAFTENFDDVQDNQRLITGTNEGIYLWDDVKWEAAATMPDRSQLNNMQPADGRYPWIGNIRQYWFSEFVCAGIGDVRDHRFGLGGVLRSMNGGKDWEFVRIDGTSASAIVYEVHHMYAQAPINKYCTFLATDEGVFFSDNLFHASHPDSVDFNNISINADVVGSLANLRSIIALGDEGRSNTSDPLILFASLNSAVINGNGEYEGGVYQTSTTITQLRNGEQPYWQKMPANDPNLENNIGRMVDKPYSNNSTYEIYLGKMNWPALGVVNQSDPEWKIIATKANLVDGGYRDDDTQLKFGSLTVDMYEVALNENSHPVVYACWSYGPLKADGHNGAYSAVRTYSQIFTNKTGLSEGGVKYYESRGEQDEVFFDGPMPAFHPNNSNIIMVGSGDNQLMRSIDGGQTWSSRRLRPVDEWQGRYGTDMQFVYHIAFHPDKERVFASAGPENRKGGNSRGELLVNDQEGSGAAASWIWWGGGPEERKGLPEGEIQSFTFDRRAPMRGLYVAVRGYGIYYAKVESNGGITPATGFVKISDDADLVAKIPAAGGENQKHHYYSRIMFDPYDKDVLYIARHWPAGGVFRVRLDTTTSNSRRVPVTSGGSYNQAFIKSVDEVIKGAYNNLGNKITPLDSNATCDVINILVTKDHVFAGTTSGRGVDQGGRNYAGGLVKWTKTEIVPPSNQLSNNWVIGGPNGNPTNTIAIGGLAQDPKNASDILAVTYRFGLKADRTNNAGDLLYQGEENYKLMNVWLSTDTGATFSALSNSAIGHRWPDAVSLAFFPNDSDKIIMPTHGNGIWIGSRTGSGKIAVTAVGLETDAGLPKRLALHKNYPNPFSARGRGTSGRPATTIQYDLPKTSDVTLAVYDVLGRRVRILVDRQMKAGYHHTLWDGKNEDGVRVITGIYFYRISTPEFSKVRKLMLLP